MTKQLLPDERADWVICLHCLHVWYFPATKICTEACNQCGGTQTKRRILVTEVTRALRRHMPNAIRQYTMKATKRPRKEEPTWKR